MQTVGPYTLLSRLGTGAVAETWLARGPARVVVVKRLLPHLHEDDFVIRALFTEAKLLARLVHPNIVRLLDVDDGLMAMEFHHGVELARLVRRARRRERVIPRPIVLRIFAEACRALHCAHTFPDDLGQRLPIIHRDLSPSCLRVGFDGSVKVADFGLAKVFDQASRSGPGLRHGKFLYLAPEQAAGRPLDARTDLFLLGLVLYELLTGVRPFVRDSELATLKAALAEEIAPASAVAQVPPEVDRVVMRALARAPAERYPDAAAFGAALEALLEHEAPAPNATGLARFVAELFPEEVRRLLAQLVGRDARGGEERLVAVLGDDDAVSLENEPTGARFFVSRRDTLVVRTGAAAEPGACWSCLDFVSAETGPQQVGGFHLSVDALAARDLAKLTAFAETVAAAAGCRVEWIRGAHRG